MFEIQNTLLKFSSEKQGIIFEAFQSLSLLLEDEELAKVVNKNNNNNNYNEVDSTNNNNLKLIDDSEMEIAENELLIDNNNNNNNNNNNPKSPLSKNEDGESLLEENVATKITTLESLTSPSSSKNLTTTTTTTTTTRKINLSRLESLLSSEDAKVRLYSLEKLHKLLYHSSQTDPVVVVVEGKLLFSSDYELDSLVKCLFRCLKRSIHARDNNNNNKPRSRLTDVDNNESTENNNSNNQNYKEINDKKTTKASSSTTTTTTRSTAARLIQTALKSTNTDVSAVLLAVDCLWLVCHFPHDIILNHSLGWVGKHYSDNNNSEELMTTKGIKYY